MHRLVIGVASVAVTGILLGGLVTVTRASTSQATQVVATGVVLGSGAYSPIVRDFDVSMAFYHDALGLDIPAATPPRLWDTEEWHRHLHGLPGSTMRYSRATMPAGTAPRLGVEIVEHGEADRKPVAPRIQDPGASAMILLVRDVDAAFARAKKAGASVVTSGGGPIEVAAYGGKSRAVIVKDPDGHFVELLQLDPLPTTSGSPDSNLLGARLRFTIADTEKTLHLYGDLFGVPAQMGSFTTDKSFAALMGLPAAQLRVSKIQFPRSNLQTEFLEVKGVDRKPIQSRIQDPGSTRLQLNVTNVETARMLLQTAGPSTVVSTTGKIEPTGHWERGIVDRTVGATGAPGDQPVRYLVASDLNNLFLVLSDRPQQASVGRR